MYLNNRRKWFLFFCFCAAVLWLFFIFSNSLENMQVSGGKSAALLQFLDQRLNLNLSLMSSQKNNRILRKLAHFGEFFLLGLLMRSVFKGKALAQRSFLLLFAHRRGPGGDDRRCLKHITPSADFRSFHNTAPFPFSESLRLFGPFYSH